MIRTYQSPGHTLAVLRADAGTQVYVDPATNTYGTYLGTAYGETTPKWNELHRSIFVFDTSGVPSSATITGVTLQIYVVSVANTAGLTNAQAGMSIVNAFPDSDTTLATADYLHLGTTRYATDIAYNLITTSALNSFTLNDTGIAQIGKGAGGVFRCGLAMAWDTDNSTPAWPGAPKSTSVYIYFNAKGTTYRPLLTVTYTTGTPATVDSPKVSLSATKATPVVTGLATEDLAVKAISVTKKTPAATAGYSVDCEIL